MFKKIRRRLVLLNALVFFIFLCGFGVAIYFYANYRLLGQVDHDLNELATHFQKEQINNILHAEVDERESDQHVVYLIWNKNNQLIREIPEDAFTPSDLTAIQTNLTKLPSIEEGNLLTTMSLSGHSYRALTFPVQSGSNLASLSNASKVQLVLKIDPEINMLQTLQLIIILGGLMGGAVSLSAGFFLAERALVPIRSAWDKQQRFVADASHELRTPLTVISTHLELLFRHPDHTIEQDSKTIYTALNETKRISKMVSSLLTLARADSNELELQLKMLELDKLILKVVEPFYQVAAIKEIEMKANLSDKVLFYGDEERLHQLLVILLDNAVKFTPPQGTVAITCRQTKSSINITVEDTGSGIPEEDLPFIFDRFYRGNKARPRSAGGTGLGLSIARWIVEVHGGSLKAESKKNKGTKMLMTFPTRTSEWPKNKKISS